MANAIAESKDSNKLFKDTIFLSNNKHVSETWVSLRELYPEGIDRTLLPQVLSIEQFSQGIHYECFMLSAIAALLSNPEAIRRCFVTKNVRQDGRYTFQFFRGKSWVKVEIDDTIPLENDQVIYIQSPTHHWWPLLLEKAYAKFYKAYDHLEGCTLHETFHDLTGNPVLNIPVDERLAKIAGMRLMESDFWLGIGCSIRSGDIVASVLTKDSELEQYGIQSDQQYSILNIFTLKDGSTSLSDIVVLLYNPFEDEQYCGPLCASDSFWTPELKSKFPSVNDPHLIHVPFANFLRWSSYFQQCFMRKVENDATYFSDEWRGATAGGGPSYVSWRENPMYIVRNTGTSPISMIVCLKQEDQRRFTHPDETTKYVQCGVVLSQCVMGQPIPTRWVTGNNHRPIHKSLFLNSREVTSVLSIPPGSTCYLVPSAMNKGTEARFLLALYRFKFEDYSNLSLCKLAIPGIQWNSPVSKSLEVNENEKKRVDFTVSQPCDVHFLLHQTRPYITKSGGDARTQDYLALQLHNEDGRKMEGGNVATNCRDAGLSYSLPAAGRYTICVTCAQAKSGDSVMAVLYCAAADGTDVAFVDPPPDAPPLVELDQLSIEGDDDTDEVTSVDNPLRSFNSERLLRSPGALGRKRHEASLHSLMESEIEEEAAMDGFGSVVEATKLPSPVKQRRSSEASDSVDDQRSINLVKVDTISCGDLSRGYTSSLSRRSMGAPSIGGAVSNQSSEFDTSRRPLQSPKSTHECDSVMTLRGQYSPGSSMGCASHESVPQVAHFEKRGTVVADPLSSSRGLPLGCGATQELPSEVLAEDMRKREERRKEFVLEAAHEGVPLESLELSKETSFVTMEIQRESLLQKSKENISEEEKETLENRIAALEMKMNKLVQELRKERLGPARSYLDPAPAGVQLKYLPLSEDPSFVELETVRDGLVLTQPCDPKKLSAVEEKLNHRAREIAKKVKEDDLEGFPRVVSGISVESMQPHNDGKFNRWVEQMRDEKAAVRPNIERMDNLQKEMVAYLEILAENCLMEDRAFLDPEPEGVPLRLIRLRTDEVFREKEILRAELKKEDPRRNASTIHALEVELNARAHELARLYRVKELEGVSQYPEELPMELLHPYDDPIFFAEIQNLRELNEYSASQAVILPIKQKLTARLVELARAKLDSDRGYLTPNPRGVSLSILPLGKDLTFRSLEAKRMILKEENPRRNADAIRQLEDKLNHRTSELAELQLKRDMQGVHLEPEGIPLEFLHLDKNSTWKELIERHRGDLPIPERNKLEKEMNDLVYQLAKDLRKTCREKIVSPNPEGVPLELLSLKEDKVYDRLEIKCSCLMAAASEANAKQLTETSEEINKRVRELALIQKQRDLDDVDKEPLGLPLDLLHPHDDEKFSQLVGDVRKLRFAYATTPTEDLEEKIKIVVEAMSVRARELARLVMDRDYLEKEYNGVPVNDLPLDTDKEFTSLEWERGLIKLRNGEYLQKKIEYLETKLNECAFRLGKHQCEVDLVAVPLLVSGVPRDILNLHENPLSKPVILRLRQLRKNPSVNEEKIEMEETKLNEIAEKLGFELRIADREYLNPRPLDIPVADLPLNSDDIFKNVEGKRVALKMGKHVNSAQIKSLEMMLNQLAEESAKTVMENDLKHFKSEYKGFPIATLLPHRNLGFRRGMEKLRAMERDPTAPLDFELQELLEEILEEIASEKKFGELYFVESSPCGLPVEEINFEEDNQFQQLLEKRNKLKEEEPLERRKEILALEDQLNRRATVLARSILDEDLAEVQQRPEGIPIDLLHPSRDPEISRLIPQLRRSKSTEYLQNRKKMLIDQINERLTYLAATAITFGQSEYLDQEPEGVPISSLRVENDRIFSTRSVHHAILRLENPEGNFEKILEIEAELNARLHELAKEQLERDLEGIDHAPLGVPLSLLHPHQDSRFLTLIVEDRLLKKDPIRNMEKILSHQEVLNGRVKELARILLSEHREYLQPDPLGVPLQELPLDTDPVFHDLEVGRIIEVLCNEGKDKDKIARFENMLHQRVMELASEQLMADLADLDPAPLGVPLTLLEPHKDEKFATMIPELRRLNRDNTRNASKLKATYLKMDARTRELAEDYLNRDRELYLDPTPKGIPWKTLSLDLNSDFKALENAKFQLQDSEKKKGLSLDRISDALKKREAEINALVNDIAFQRIRSDRGYLHRSPEGVDLEDLPLDTDPTFHELEVARTAAKNSHVTSLVIDLEDQLNSRASELALEQKLEDLRDLEQNPRGIPISAVRVHEDGLFLKMVNELRQLKQMNGESSSEEIEELYQRMNARVLEICEQLLSSDRGYLKAKPNGVAIRYLPIDEDPQFRELEALRLTLKRDDLKSNADRISALEEQLNMRAHELAVQVKEADLEGLQPTWHNIPLKLINPHRDEKFSTLIEDKRALKPSEIKPSHPVIRQLDKLAEQLTAAVVKSDRSYLDREPEGIMLGALPLDEDETFHGMEVERAILRLTDAHRHKGVIADLEFQLNARCHELAQLELSKDRVYLNPTPEGVPVAVLNLHGDPKFHQMEVERARLKMRDTLSNAACVRELEVRLNDRAAELAKKQLEDDLLGLDKYPEAYPINYLNPHQDQQFAMWIPELRDAKKNRNYSKVREIHEFLNERAHELAKQRIVEERAFLDPMPEGVPLAVLPLDSDPEFCSAEKERRLWRSSVKKSDISIREAEKRMMKRLHQLAHELLVTTRSVLDQQISGIPIEDLPLDSDEQFKELENQRLQILASEFSDPKAASVLEDQMNHRLHELAEEEKRLSRHFLRDFSHGIPKSLIQLEENKSFIEQEQELRRISKTLGNASNVAALLRTELQKIADEIAKDQLMGSRPRYLHIKLEEVEIEDIPLDDDEIYMDLEVQRAILVAKDPIINNAKIMEMELTLNDRANELLVNLVHQNRLYVPADICGIPNEELPLDTDEAFLSLEAERRRYKRENNREMISDVDERLRKRAQELAEEVVAQDLMMLRDSYRSITKTELNLHADSKFRELANKRRRRKGMGVTGSREVAQIEDEMDARAAELANAIIDTDRAFLDQEPQGMMLSDLPLDTDPTFHQLEMEYRRRIRHELVDKQEKVIKELQKEMSDQANKLARIAFSRLRGFLDVEINGVAQAELGLDEDPEFKEIEVKLYRLMKSTGIPRATSIELEEKMIRRANQLARIVLSEDRRFVSPEPEGVPLEELKVDWDDEFSDLARERRRKKRAVTSPSEEELVLAVEEKMNRRAHEMAKEYLVKSRAFLPPEPQGIPLEELPLNSDPEFHRLERIRMKLRHEPDNITVYKKLKKIERELRERASELAREMHRRERAFLEQAPLGVPLEELPLNYDPVLRPMETELRTLRKEPKRYPEEIRGLEEKVAERLAEIAIEFLKKERAFMDPNPAGVPLRYLPLASDPEFHALEVEFRKQRRTGGSAEVVAGLEQKLNARARAMAKDLVERGRRFLDPEPLGVPVADVPLNEDETFRQMEEQRRALKQDPKNVHQVKALEQRLNARALQLAQDLLDAERSFLTQAPMGIPLKYLPLNTDRRTRDIERALRRYRKEKKSQNRGQIRILKDQLEARVLELARQELADDRKYLSPEPCGVPLKDLNLDEDPTFHKMEVDRFLKKRQAGRRDGNVTRLEELLNERVHEMAGAVLQNERYYLDQEPEGIPLSRLPLHKDPEFHAMELERRELLTARRGKEELGDLEKRMNNRVHELALAIRGWQDEDFHSANEQIAEKWVRICELFPEGRRYRIDPNAVTCPDVCSAPGDVGYLAPFIAALSRHSVLLQRLIVTTDHPIHGPYTFVFFDPNSNPVYVDIDDRIPCTEELSPKFIWSIRRLWFPLLLEKAYAKFVGGYAQVDNCTPHETLRDLTGRPVTHIPFDRKLAHAANSGDFSSVNFWRGISDDMKRGDVIVCMSNGPETTDGLHPQCTYALLDVVETVDGSNNLADIVLKLHNAYQCADPEYCGPLCKDDTNWNDDLRRVCKFEPHRQDILYIPLPTFLRNFSSLQRCHINCGDRLTATGVWDRISSGGNPKFTTFRNNPIFVVTNKSTRPATILAEVRHTCAHYVDQDGLNHYPQTGLLLMQPLALTAPPTPLITNSTHRFLQKGMMLDSREVCSVMELPPQSTCYIVPYTLKRGQIGSFNLSIYPGLAKVTLSPLLNAGLGKEPVSTRITVHPGSEGKRIDMLLPQAADVHVLLHQEKVTDQRFVEKGDVLAEDDITISAYSEDGVKVASSGPASNAREHSMVFSVKDSGRIFLYIWSPNQPVSGPCPCTISVYTTKGVKAKFVPSSSNAPPLQEAPRRPTIPAITAGSKNPKPPRRPYCATQSENTVDGSPFFADRPAYST